MPGAPSLFAGRRLTGRCPTNQSGEARRVKGRRHGDEREVAAQLADFGEHSEEEVGLQPAFVDLVEDHGIGALETRIGEEAPQQNARGNEFNQGSRPGLAFSADRVADAVTEPAAVQGRPVAGRRNGRPPGAAG